MPVRAPDPRRSAQATQPQGVGPMQSGWDNNLSPYQIADSGGQLPPIPIEQISDLAPQPNAGRILLVVSGSSVYNRQELFVEMYGGDVWNVLLFVPDLDTYVQSVFEAFGVTEGPRPSRIVRGRAYPDWNVFEGQIRIAVSPLGVNFVVLSPPNLEPALRYYPTSELEPEAENRRLDARQIYISELYFGNARLLDVDDGVMSRLPPKKIDVRTRESVPW